MQQDNVKLKSLLSIMLILQIIKKTIFLSSQEGEKGTINKPTNN